MWVHFVNTDGFHTGRLGKFVSFLFEIHDGNATRGSEATVSLSQMSWEGSASPMSSFKGFQPKGLLHALYSCQW